MQCFKSHLSTLGVSKTLSTAAPLFMENEQSLSKDHRTSKRRTVQISPKEAVVLKQHAQSLRKFYGTGDDSARLEYQKPEILWNLLKEVWREHFTVSEKHGVVFTLLSPEQISRHLLSLPINTTPVLIFFSIPGIPEDAQKLWKNNQ